MRFTNVAKDFDKDPIEWCGHDHESFESAHDCPWKPEAITYAEGKAYLPDIYIEADWDPILHCKCPHLCHPLECDRCIEYRTLVTPCVHSYDPLTCRRCFIHDRWGVESSFPEFTDEEIEAEVQKENELLSKLLLRQMYGSLPQSGEDDSSREGIEASDQMQDRSDQGSEDSASGGIQSAVCDDMDASEPSEDSERSEQDYLQDSHGVGYDNGTGESEES